MSRKSPSLRQSLSGLWEKCRLGTRSRLSHVTTELTAETSPVEPVDFSAPSVRYYDRLADRFSMARVVLFMILVVFLMVTIISNRRLITHSNLYYMVRDINAATVTAQSQSAYLSYPVSNVTPDLRTYRGGLVVAGGNELTVLSGSGKHTLTEGVTYADPCVRADDKYFLVFGRGEKGFSVYNTFGRMYREDTDYPIYDACMSATGAFAVVTRSRDYTSEVILYNDDMERLAVVHLKGYATALAANPAGDVIAILSADQSQGAYAAKLTLLRMGDRLTTEETTWEHTLVGSAAFLTDDRLAFICQDRLLITDTDGDVRAETSFQGNRPSLCAIGSNVAVVFNDAAGLGQAVLRVYDRNGHESYAAILPWSNEIQEMTWNQGTVYLRSTDRLLRITDSGKRVSALKIGRDTLCLLDAGKDTPLICTPAYAYHPDSADFHAIEGN